MKTASYSLLASLLLLACQPDEGSPSSGPLAAAPAPAPAPAADARQKLVAEIVRGSHLVKIAGCNDCHTPLKMGEHGPEPDMSRMLSGHPAAMALPPAPSASGPWMASVAATMTGWSGPWGVSFTANLTPDKKTGLGEWSYENFEQTIRTGRHLGRGRPILPPMPIPALQQFTDEELHAVYTYLQSIPAIENAVPAPLPPAAAAPGKAG